MAEILFEKLIQDDSIETPALIAASEARRVFLQQITYKKDTSERAIAYYNAFCTLVERMHQEKSHIVNHPLFFWGNQGSSCWAYEQLNLEHHIALALADKAALTPAKESCKLLKQAIQYCLKSIDTLRAYLWEDVSITRLPIAQERFHLYHVAKMATRYYTTMNKHSIAEKGKPNGVCTERAFYFSDFAANIWVETKENNIERHVRKAEYLLWHVQAMDEDKCGEKLAILKDLIGIKHTPEAVGTEYKCLQQMNESVYYHPIETSFKINYPSLDALMTMLP